MARSAQRASRGTSPDPRPTAAQCCRISHSGQGRAEGFSRFLPPLPSAIGFPTAARGAHRRSAGSLYTFPVTQCFPRHSGVCGGVQRAPLRLPSSPGFSTVARSRHGGSEGSNCNLLIAGGYSSQPLQRSTAAAPRRRAAAALVMANTLFQQHRRLYTRTSPDRQYRNQIDYILCNQRWRSSTQSAKTRPGADCVSD